MLDANLLGGLSYFGHQPTWSKIFLCIHDPFPILFTACCTHTVNPVNLWGILFSPDFFGPPESSMVTHDGRLSGLAVEMLSSSKLRVMLPQASKSNGFIIHLSTNKSIRSIAESFCQKFFHPHHGVFCWQWDAMNHQKLTPLQCSEILELQAASHG